jgi:TQO small subunit DoxD
MAFDTRLPGWPLAIFRIAFGLLYLHMAVQKAPWVPAPEPYRGLGYGWLRGFIDQEIAYPTFPFVVNFLKQVVVPNFGLFGMLTFIVELALGLGLFLGVLTRLVGLGGFLWQVNIALQAFNVPGEWPWIWVLLTLPQFCFAFCGAGRVLGLDAWLAPELRRRAADGSTSARLLQSAA